MSQNDTTDDEPQGSSNGAVLALCIACFSLGFTLSGLLHTIARLP